MNKCDALFEGCIVAFCCGTLGKQTNVCWDLVSLLLVELHAMNLNIDKLLHLYSNGKT